MSRTNGRSRSLLIVIPMVAITLIAASCSSDDTEIPTSADPEAIEVAASFYPVAAAARAIGGGCVDVVDLTPPGVEPHDLELTPDDIEAIASAEIVLYLGSGFQPSVEDALGDAQGSTLDVLGLVSTVPAPPSEAEEGLLVDPHIWLDPGLWAQVVPQIATTMADAAADAPCDLAANAEDYAADVAALDEEFARGLRDCEVDTLVTNHAAFGYLASAYGLTQEPISGLEPDAEPTPERLAQLNELVRATGVTTIFSEELVSPEVAQTLADEAGIETATLNTLEGLTPEEIDANEDYASVMRTNLATLRSGLGCS